MEVSPSETKIERRRSFLLDGRMELRGVVNSREYQKIRHALKWEKMNSKTYWHKFIVMNSSSLPKEFILRLIVEVVSASSSMEFIPFMFHTEGENSVFYARDCVAVIDILLRFNLIIENPRGGSLILQIEIDTTDSVSHYNVGALVASTISKRYSAATTTLNLSNFHNDPDLEPIIFYPLSVHKALMEVMSHSCTNTGKVNSINLANNCLVKIDATKMLLRLLSELKTLDLRNNNLEITALEPLRGLNVKEVLLDGNPLCEIFETETQYVNQIRKYFPDMEWLDGVRLGLVGPPRMHSFFLCVPSAQQLVEQFIEHYFSLYDSDHRDMLLGTYHPVAVMSITCCYLANQTTSANSRLTRYSAENRNLIRLPDCSKIDKLLRKNNTEVLELLCSLPKTEHDPSTFTVDLLVYSSTMAVLSVTGLFREPANPSYSVRYFKRVFTLMPSGSSTFYIINDLLYVTNCTTEQAEVAFTTPPPERPLSPLKVLLTCRQAPRLRKAEKRDNISTVSDLTEMNKRWSKKCLVDMKWDIRGALILFNEAYRAGEIPIEAFIK